MNEELKGLLEAAAHGNVDAMVTAGDCYYYGVYTEADDVKAQKYYRMAADRGNPAAIYMVGVGHLVGAGVEEDESKAISYIRTAADKGWALAQCKLAKLYIGGKITPWHREREQKAIEYSEKAAKQGLAEAQVHLAKMIITGNEEKALFWLVCAYLHGKEAEEDSQEALKWLNELIKSELPGGKNRIDKIIREVKAKHPSLIKNPDGVIFV